MINFQNTLKMAQMSFLLAALLLSACAKRASYDSSASRVDSLNITNPHALCSEGKDTKNGTSLTMILKAIEATNDGSSYLNDWTAAALENIPASFKTENHYVQFWKWKASADGTTYMDKSAPLQFYILRKDTLQYISTALTQITWEELQKLLIAQNIPASTLEQAFQNIRFSVYVQDLTWDVLRVNFYNSSDTAQAQVDALIPIFDADPNDYKTLPTEEIQGGSQTARPEVLLRLHPFYSMMNQSWTRTDFQNQSLGLCKRF